MKDLSCIKKKYYDCAREFLIIPSFSEDLLANVELEPWTEITGKYFYLINLRRNEIRRK